MTCARIRRAIGPDRPLPSWAHAHLAKCAACQAYLEDLKRLRRALAELADVPVPEDFPHRLRARVRAFAVPPARTFTLWPRALALATLAGLAFAVLFTIGREPKKPHSPHPSLAESVTPHRPPVWRPATPSAPSSEVSRHARSKGHSSMTMLARSGSTRVPPATKPTGEPEPTLVPLPETNATDLLGDRFLQDGVILLLRNEETQEESVLAIPPIVFGSRPLIPLPVSVSREERRKIL